MYQEEAHQIPTRMQGVISWILAYLMIGFIFGHAWSPLAFGKALADDSYISENLFKLQRLNFKAHKTLHYNVYLHKESCKIRGKGPLDIFYALESSSSSRPNKLPLSASSKAYFDGKEVQVMNDHQMQFTFRAYSDFSEKVKELGPIRVLIEKKNDSCHARAMIVYQKKEYQLRKVEIQFKLLLGVIVGLDYVRLKVKEGDKEGMVDLCPTANCPTWPVFKPIHSF